ncbi:MAG: hypothetical protein QOF84_3610 [Streptomyces sp.]|nr:hypothetical protein [Streptomyces sp.]
MRGDEVQQADVTVGGGPRVRTGPRHAAPRKSLLTKLQVPAGKAIAIAAMPTAVLMGMGLTPRLASADELPKNPFSGTSCSDTTDESATPSASSSSASPSASSKSSSSSSDSASSSKATATPTPSASSSTKSSSSSSGGKTSTPTATSTPSASASASSTTNPLDPLGVGDALKDLLGINSTTSSSSTSAKTSSSSATPTATATPKASSTTDSASDTATKAAKKTTDNATSSAADTLAKATKAANQAAATATASPSASASSTDTPYPCATHDAQALADAQSQDTSSLLPDTPWTLKTDLLTLTGLDYKGIVEVKTYNGTVKKVLKFTATGVDIKNLHQIVDGPNGTKSHVQAAAGSTSTIKDGTVTMYTESLKGNLFGLIPVTFTPDTPPPVNVPVAFFTNVTVIQAGQFGGTLTVPGMHLYSSS